MNLPRTTRRVTRTALVGASVPCALLLASVEVNSWGQTPSSAQVAPAAKAADPGPGNDREGPDADQPIEALEVLEAHLEAKRALLRIDEARAEQAKRWKDYYEKQTRDGKVPEDRLLAARDDVLMIEAHVMAERADLKAAEIRTKYARSHAAPGDRATSVAQQHREELDVLQAQLDGKRALLQAGEARAKQSRKVEAHYERLFHDGMATEDELLAVKDDVLLIDSALAWGRADVKAAEARLQGAQRQGAHGGPATAGASRRLAELAERLAVSEMKVDMLQHEVGRLRRELPRETHGAR